MITNFKQTIEILKKTRSTVAAPQPLTGDFSVVSQNLVCDRRPPM